MSRIAIAAALALDDVAGGERLVAFALASFANREHLAWPGAPAAAARAGLARSRYLEAHGRLLRRGLIDIYERGGGRGRSTTVLLRFAEGQRWDGPVNAELFETALSYSRSSGPARLLLASIAALADEQGELDGVTADELSAAAGLARSTYRRARSAAITSGELELVRELGGRGRTNRWRVADLRSTDEVRGRRPQRRTPAGPARPLMTPAAPPLADDERTTAANSASETTGLHAPVDAVTAGKKGAQIRTASAVNGAEDRTGPRGKVAQDRTVSDGKGAQDRTVSDGKGAQDRTVSDGKGAQDRTVSGGKGAQDRTVSRVKGAQDRIVSDVKGAQDRTVSGARRVETRPERGPEKGPPNARAWKEPGNRRTVNPPSPPDGGSHDGGVFVEESYVTDRGRKRTRRVAVDVDAIVRKLRAPGSADEAAWREIRTLMRQAVGESTFGIWLSQLELAAIDLEGRFVLVGPEGTLARVQHRFDRLISCCCAHAGHSLRFATESEQLVLRSGLAPHGESVTSQQPTINRRAS